VLRESSIIRIPVSRAHRIREGHHVIVVGWVIDRRILSFEGVVSSPVHCSYHSPDVKRNETHTFNVRAHVMLRRQNYNFRHEQPRFHNLIQLDSRFGGEKRERRGIIHRLTPQALDGPERDLAVENIAERSMSFNRCKPSPSSASSTNRGDDPRRPLSPKRD